MDDQEYEKLCEIYAVDIAEAEAEGGPLDRPGKEFLISCFQMAHVWLPPKRRVPKG